MSKIEIKEKKIISLKSNYVWAGVFVVIVGLVVFFSIKTIPDLMEYIYENKDKNVSTSDVSQDPNEEILNNKILGKDSLVNSLEVEKETESFKFGFLVNDQASDLIFVITAPDGTKYNTWENMIPDFAKLEAYSEGFYVLTVDWKQARMMKGTYEVTAYGVDLDSFVVVEV